MWTEIAVPAWVVIVLSGLSLLAILDRLLIPSVRFALRRRADRAVDELNTRLHLRIEPFKLTRRKVLIDRLLSDPEVLTAVGRHARETEVPHDVAMEKAARYASEIVPSFSAFAYFRVGTRLARRISQALYRVRVGFANDAALRAVPADASVVFVINHRSNMDYVLVTYVAARSSALSYAVGEWAQIWGLRSLIRSMGAYFIRRNSRDSLYRTILARYVDMATKAGVVQAIFPEGGLTRDGMLKPPKYGLLSYIVSDFDPRAPRDVVFIPVGLNYDRVLEDRILTSARDLAPGEAPRFRVSPAAVAGFLGHNLWLAATGRWYRYGYACVSFGKPVSLAGWLATRHLDLRTLSPEMRQPHVAALGSELIEAVGRVVPALPVPLVATVLTEAGGVPLTLFELKGRVFDLISALEAAGAYVHIPRQDRDYAIEVGLRILKSRRLILVDADDYRLNPDELHILRYYANSLTHFGSPPDQSSRNAAPATPPPPEPAAPATVEATPQSASLVPRRDAH